MLFHCLGNKFDLIALNQQNHLSMTVTNKQKWRLLIMKMLVFTGKHVSICKQGNLKIIITFHFEQRSLKMCATNIYVNGIPLLYTCLPPLCTCIFGFIPQGSPSLPVIYMWKSANWKAQNTPGISVINSRNIGKLLSWRRVRGNVHPNRSLLFLKYTVCISGCCFSITYTKTQTNKQTKIKKTITNNNQATKNLKKKVKKTVIYITC